MLGNVAKKEIYAPFNVKLFAIKIKLDILQSIGCEIDFLHELVHRAMRKTTPNLIAKSIKIIILSCHIYKE